jgi:hypothetical protein
MHINPGWCLRTRGGKKVLVLEADAINVNDALMLGKPSTDLTAQEAFLAFRMIETLVSERFPKHVDKVLKVTLADSLAPMKTGGGMLIGQIRQSEFF